MKKGIILSVLFIVLALLLVFGCSKTNPTEPDTTPVSTITATVTPYPTSTAVASPNLSGSVTFPSDAIGKQFAVCADTDTNTANGSAAVFYGTIDSLTEEYAFEVTMGTYYIYAFVDMNGSGLVSGPGGFDYVGSWNSWSGTMPVSNGLDFNCDEQLPAVITLNLTLPADAAGKSCFFGLFDADSPQEIGEPVAGITQDAPAGTQFSVSFTYEGKSGNGPFYLIAFVDADGSNNGQGGMPNEGDYIKVYGGSGANWPAAKNVMINGDTTLSMTLAVAAANVSGTATLPGSANSKYYTVFISSLPLGPGMEEGMLVTKTAQAGTGSTINYSAYCPIPGNYYVTLIVDMDGSGWDNGESGPTSIGDFAGVYGVTPPIVNWMNPFPPQPNAAVPGIGYNFTCDTVPDMSNPYETPTPYPTPDATAVGEGSISGTVTLPSGQSGKTLNVMVDLDTNPNNDNFVGMFQVYIGTATSLTYSVSNVPAGTYYIYCGAVNENAPLIGDAVGVYGATYPAFPASPNAVVTSGGNLTANITTVTAQANLSGRVYMPSAVTVGRNWAVLLDYDMDGGNDNHISVTAGVISTSQNYFDYSMLVPLPGNYYIYAVVDSAEPYDLFTNGPGCDDLIGFHSVPNPVYLTPAGVNTGKNISVSPNTYNCP